MEKEIRPIAIYLPQYHPIPENDAWWGKGFTEWTNVTKARPLFKGHYQPHLPADLGFYDLRLPEIREQQAAMAKEHGIYGFCYYHYWFNGHRLLNRPFDEIIASGKPDFPFMLCWANENWSRRWDGSEKDILLSQNYTHDDDLAHIKQLCKFFADKRYIRVNGKPFFIIYRPVLFPDIEKTVHTWREEARNLGIGELYLAYVNSSYTVESTLVFENCFDAAVEFNAHVPYSVFTEQKLDLTNFFSKLKKKVKRKIDVKIKKKTHFVRTYDYSTYAQSQLDKPEVPFKQYPDVFPGWDNTARKGERGSIATGSTPELYGNWLKKVIQKFKPYSPEENFIFINAWNEWAEGNHLEPCQKWGNAYLLATKKALEDAGESGI